MEIKDRVKESTISTGVGDVTLAGAFAGYQAFGDVFAEGDEVPYCYVGGTEWEVGLGTFNLSLNTFSRDTVEDSSNSGALVVFSVGTKSIFCSATATAVEAMVNFRRDMTILYRLGL